MDKVRTFEGSDRIDLQRDINDFIKNKEVKGTSIATSLLGYTTYYTALIWYREVE